MIRHLIPLTATLMATVSLSPAQGPPPAQAKLRLLAFTPALQLEEAYAHDPAADEGVAGVPAPIKTYLNHQFSTVLTKSRKVVFTTKPDHGSINRPGEVIGEGTLPAAGNTAIFVFLPGKPGDKAKDQVMVIDDSKRTFPPGSFHITNIGTQTVRLTLETTNYDFPPGKVTLITDPPVGEIQQSIMQAFVQKGTNWVRVAAGRWPHPGRGRSLALIFQNPVSGNIELKGFDDMPATEATEGQGTVASPAHP